MDDKKEKRSLGSGFEHLSEVLGSLVKGYRTLLDIVRKEKDLLVLSDIEQLNESNLSKELILGKIQNIENKRVQAVKEVCVLLGQKQKDLGLQELAKLSKDVAGVDHSVTDKLMNYHSVLNLLLNRIVDLNRENQPLAESALKVVSGALVDIRGIQEIQPTYKNKGQLSQGQNSGRLMNRQA